ncbi:MAG: hypothetical protein FWF57_04235 [Defluviitaleaceae bacterium]|nr:hypothetical protein [Defluviitaleaceae bacterium]
MNDEQWANWLNSLSELNLENLSDEEFNEWLSSLDIYSLTEERFRELLERL